MSFDHIEYLIKRLSKLPGLGPSSSKRLVLYLLQHKDDVMLPVIEHLGQMAEQIQTCEVCGNLDMVTPCSICSDDNRGGGLICVVEQVGDLWAMERSGAFKGKYHILGGTLSALDGIMPEDLRIAELKERCLKEGIKEVILATSATTGGQVTAHYIAAQFDDCEIETSALAQGVPLGGELDWLDEGTISTAFRSRSKLQSAGNDEH